MRIKPHQILLWFLVGFSENLALKRNDVRKKISLARSLTSFLKRHKRAFAWMMQLHWSFSATRFNSRESLRCCKMSKDSLGLRFYLKAPETEVTERSNLQHQKHSDCLFRLLYERKFCVFSSSWCRLTSPEFNSFTSPWGTISRCWESRESQM